MSSRFNQRLVNLICWISVPFERTGLYYSETYEAVVDGLSDAYRFPL